MTLLKTLGFSLNYRAGYHCRSLRPTTPVRIGSSGVDVSPMNLMGGILVPRSVECVYRARLAKNVVAFPGAALLF